MFFVIKSMINRATDLAIIFLCCALFVVAMSSVDATYQTGVASLKDVIRDAVPVSEYWGNGKQSLKLTLDKCAFSARINEFDGQVKGVRINDRITILVLEQDIDKEKSEVLLSEMEFARTWLSFRYADWNEGFEIRPPDGFQRTVHPDNKQ